MNSGDTLGRLDNTLSENVYILHGSADDNVPVDQARTMKAKLEALHHPSLQYHEQPGAGHWWGNQCVDWPPIFQMIEDSRLNMNADHVDFTTQNPAVAATDRWVTIDQQEECLSPSHIVADKGAGGALRVTTENVAEFHLATVAPDSKVVIDGQTLPGASGYVLRDGKWKIGGPSKSEKNGERGSGFKQVFNHRFAFVVGTHGTAEENDWALSRAIFYAETMMYRGNGSVDIALDRDFSEGRFRGRNLVLFGNEKSNSAWKRLLGKCPAPQAPPATGGLTIYPKPGETDTLVGAVFGSDPQGMRQTDRLALFSSGVDYPDWILFNQSYPEGVMSDGFFDNRWRLDPKQTAMAVANGAVAK
jgi:hypothetical protein